MQFLGASDSISQQLDDVQRSTLHFQKEKDQIHILDVGQGSALLLKSKAGQTILIDSGRHDDKSQRILYYLDQFVGTGNTIDLAIFTHSDSDHIGHADLIFDYYNVKEVWMNGKDNTTSMYFNLLEAIERSDAKYVEPKAGEHHTVGDFEIDVLHPQIGGEYKDQNEASIIGRIALGKLSLMFSGDASSVVEDHVIETAHIPLASYLLITGHHGSKYSTGSNWIQAVNPHIAFYQAGSHNSYGHPHAQLRKRLADYGVPLYGTAELGTISIYIQADGTIDVQTEVQEKGMRTQ
ncbi:ComEC/Rec2 family competence protein [Allofustis seminis]|uniref:ComEC/Rec2 family competence protein n=1 Tax=Allofustis seminis TaxID=166939 RepID=UPI0003824EBE|nr:MBL fold metallo-hydrolase [Allofustis seminis]